MVKQFIQNINKLDKDGSGKTRPNQEVSHAFPFSAHLDYLRFTSTIGGHEALKLLLDYLAGFSEGQSAQYAFVVDCPWSPGSNALWYKNTIKGFTFSGGYEELSDKTVKFTVDLTGSYFETVSVIDQWRLLRGLMYTYQVTCNRIDLAIDDPTYQIVPINEMVSAWERGDNALFKKYKTISEGLNPDNMKQTHYFGSRNSGKMVRVYDHDGECLRFEAEFKRNHAPIIFGMIATIEREDMVANNEDSQETDQLALYGCKDEWELFIQKKMASLAIGVLDFVDKSNHDTKRTANYKDCKRLEFWQEFIDKIGEHLRIRGVRLGKSLEKTIAWMQRQVATTVSMFNLGLGDEKFAIIMRRFAKNNQHRLDSFHRMCVNVIGENPKLLNSLIYRVPA